jgi:hypothetical protein
MHHAAAQHADHGNSGPGGSHAYKVCPFAVAGAAAPVSLPAATADEVRPAPFAAVWSTSRHIAYAGPPRSQAPRAPPSFS